MPGSLRRTTTARKHLLVVLPLALAAGTSARISRNVDRVLVHTVSATGLTAVVVVVYLVIVIGLGRSPGDEERTLLVLSMLAAAVASLAYVPARERLAESANRLVYGERHPPDEVLRTWGSRLSRSIQSELAAAQVPEVERARLSANGLFERGQRLRSALRFEQREAELIVREGIERRELQLRLELRDGAVEPVRSGHGVREQDPAQVVVRAANAGVLLQSLIQRGARALVLARVAVDAADEDVRLRDRPRLDDPGEEPLGQGRLV